VLGTNIFFSRKLQWNICSLGLLLALLPGSERFADAADDQSICDSGATLKEAQREMADHTEYPETRALRIDELLYDATDRCKAKFDPAQVQQIRSMLGAASADCVIRLRKSIPANMKNRDISHEADSLAGCENQHGDPEDQTAVEVKKLKTENKLALAERENSCHGATVDVSAMGPVRDQGDIGWCYAHAAADLVSFQLGRRISAIDLAMNYNDGVLFRLKKKFGESEFSKEGGQIDAAIGSESSKGFCAEEDFRGDIDGAASTLEYYRKLEQIKNMLGKPEATPEYICQEGYKLASEVMQGLSVQDFANVLYHVPKDQMFDAFRNVSCRDRIHLPAKSKLTEVSKGTSTAASLVTQMDQVLDQKQPVGINVMGTRIYGGDPGTAHAVTVVGRRFDKSTGECQYRIRNSWGSDWEDGGYRWVSKEDVQNNLYKIVYFK